MTPSEIIEYSLSHNIDLTSIIYNNTLNYKVIPVKGHLEDDGKECRFVIEKPMSLFFTFDSGMRSEPDYYKCLNHPEHTLAAMAMYQDNPDLILIYDETTFGNRRLTIEVWTHFIENVGITTPERLEDLNRTAQECKKKRRQASM